MKKRRVWLFGVGILAVALILGFAFTARRKRANTALANGGFEVEALAKRDLVNAIGAAGTVVSAEKIGVSSELANVKVKAVHVKVGDTVNKGDAICELDGEDVERSLENAQKELATTKKQNDVAERTAKRNLNDAKLNRGNQREAANEAVKNAKKAYDDAVKERDGLKRDYKKAKSSGNLEAEDALKKQYEASVDAAKAAKESYEKAIRERKQTESASASSVANMEDALTSTRIGNESKVEALQNQIEEYRKQLKKTTVKAKNEGVVTGLSVTQGQIYMGGDIATLEDAGDLVITAEIEEYEISDVTEGDYVKIKTEATGEEELDGTVTYVSQVATNASPTAASSSMAGAGGGGVTYEVKVTMKDGNERIRLGMSAKLSIVVDEVQDVFAVPYDAIQEKENGEKFVFIMLAATGREEGAKTQTKVETGMESNYYVEIKGEGLKEGLEVYVPVEQSGTPSMDEMRGVFGGREREGGNDRTRVE